MKVLNMFTDVQQTLRDRVREIYELAESKGYRVPEYRYTATDLRGRAAGQACYNRESEVADIRLNLEAAKLDMRHMLEDTIPHEVAHIIAFHNGTDRGHGRVWRSICIDLGGSGERCHSIGLTPARKVNRFKYITSNGGEVVLTSVRHNKLQCGKIISYTAEQHGQRSKIYANSEWSRI